MNISINIFLSTLLLLLLGGAKCSAATAAQETDSLSWTDAVYIQYTNAWLAHKNASGLEYLSIKKLSTAEAYARKSNGRFINYHESNDSYALGATISSLQRLGDKIVLSGSFAYDNFTGHNMGGSTFWNPYENAFDISEMSDTTQGTKNTEQYRMQGAISIKLTKKLTIGGRVNYSVGNYTKTKDLRHINDLLDAQTVLGSTYRITSRFALGAHYEYTRRIEGVQFAIQGNTDRQYLSLIDFGGFYGFSELFDRSGYTVDKKPMVNNTHRASFQAEWIIRPGLQWLNDISYGTKSGYYGKRGSTSIVYTENESALITYQGTAVLKSSHSTHYFNLNADYESRNNYENIFRTGTSTGGNTEIIYIGQSEALRASLITGAIDYKGFINVKDNNPIWAVDVGIKYYLRNQTTIRYPFYRHQTINSYLIHAGAKKNIIRKREMYSLSLTTRYGSGFGTAKDDGTYVTPSEGQRIPASRDVYLYQEYEYWTAPRVIGNVEFGYSRLLKTGVRAFAKANYTHTNAFNTNYVGSTHTNAALSIGCVF